MPSVIFNSALDDQARGNIDFENDYFAAMLVTSDYQPDKKKHSKRSDVTGEVDDGFGYVAGGQAINVVVFKDDTKNYIDVILGEAVWDNATITASQVVYYKSRGGLPSKDELVASIEIGDTRSTAGRFVVTPSTIRIQN